jgi:hypothetical protein
MLLVAIVVSACKKGDEDPFMSLLTRQQRITGKWNLSAYDYYHANLYQGDTDFIYKQSGDMNKIVFTGNYYFTHTVQTMTILEYSIEIKKDGSWKKITHFMDETYYEDSEVIITQELRENKITETGTWSFIKKSPDYKNKEQILITALDRQVETGSTTSFTNYKDPSYIDQSFEIDAASHVLAFDPQTETAIYDLVMLKNKEMIWEKHGGTVNGDYTTNNFEIFTWVKK